MLGALPFSTVYRRSVDSFREEYHYNGAPKSNSSVIPSPIKNIIQKIHDDPLYGDEKINQVVINKYSGNAYLPQHFDNESTIRPNPIFSLLRLVMPYLLCLKTKLHKKKSKLEPVFMQLCHEYGVSTPLVTQD